MDDTNLETGDLLDDPSFHNWVFQRDPHDVAYWDKWIQAHPHQKSMIMEAAEIIKGISTVKPQFSSMMKRELKARILDQMPVPNQERIKSNVFSRNRWKVSLAAASIVLVLSLGIYNWMTTHPQWKIITTSQAETTMISLPDGSDVILSANSELKYTKEWTENDIREVWLTGEAYFSVDEKPIKGLPTFRVHHGEVTVEVLGTEFNVRQTNGNTEVVLNSGSVKLLHEGTRDSIWLEPGNRAIYAQGERKFFTETVDTDLYTAWKDGKMLFNETPVSEIAHRIESYYGMEVVVESKQLEDRTLTGSLNLTELDILLETLALTFQLEVNKQEGIIYLRPKNDK